MQEHFTIKEVATRWGTSEKTVRKACCSGLRNRKFGRAIRIHKDDLLAYEESCTAHKPEPSVPVTRNPKAEPKVTYTPNGKKIEWYVPGGPYRPGMRVV